MRTTLAVLATAIFTLLAIGPAAGGRALAGVRWAGNPGELDRSVAYLQGAQNPDGGFGGTKGAASEPLFTAWVGLGLAAAGVNPQDQRAPGDGTDMYTYLTANVPGPDAETTDIERAALVAVAATGSAHDVGGHDLAATILGRQRPDGSFPHAAGGAAGGINDTAFAILPLSAEPGLGDALARAAAWLVGVQGADGGWSYAPGASESTDMTGAVLQALQAAPPATGPDADARAAARIKAWSYLHAAQHADGGFGETPADGESNTASTAWVVQALWAAGEDPAGWKSSGRTPLDYLAAMQQPDGSIRYKNSQSMNDLWMTAYALPAFAGWPWPIPAVARAVAPAPAPPSTAVPAPTGGVTSGGGGRGAPLFSRPQPGSTGRASGGIRQVTASRSEAQKTTATLRAKGTKKVATGTAQSNGAAAHGVTAVRSTARRSPRRPTATPKATASGSGGSEVTGRLLGDAAATGVSGTGATPGVAPGLRTAATTSDDDAPTTALVLAGLLALAALGGAAGEARTGRKELLP